MNVILPVGGPITSSLVDAPTQFFMRLATQPTPTRKLAYVNLIQSLVAAGVWAKLDALYILAAADSATARTNLISAGSATTVNGPTFTANVGYSFTPASNTYLDTGINPSTAGGHFTRNNACMFGWILNYSPIGYASDSCLIGQNDGIPASFLTGGYDSSEHIASAVNGGAAFIALSNSWPGLYFGERTSSTNTAMYENATQIATSSSFASVAVFNGNMLIGDAGNIAAPGNVSVNPIAAAGFGMSLGPTGVAALYSALQAYMQNVAISSDPYTAFINRLKTLPSGPRQTLYSNLINGLISDGVWSKLDALWIFAAADSTTARTNLVQDAYVVKANGDGTGGDPGNANFVVNTGWNATQPSYSFQIPLATGVAGKNYQQDSAHLMFWSLTNNQIGDNSDLFPFGDGTFTTGVWADASVSGARFALVELNNATAITGGAGDQITVTDSLGMYIGTRTANNSTTLYKGLNNGSGISALATKTYLSGPHTGYLNLNTNSTNTHRAYAAASMGGALTAIDCSNLYNRVYTYLHAVGAV